MLSAREYRYAPNGGFSFFAITPNCAFCFPAMSLCWPSEERVLYVDGGGAAVVYALQEEPYPVSLRVGNWLVSVRYTYPWRYPRSCFGLVGLLRERICTCQNLVLSAGNKEGDYNTGKTKERKSYAPPSGNQRPFERYRLAVIEIVTAGFIFAAAIIPFIVRRCDSSWVYDNSTLGILFFFVVIAAGALVLRIGVVEAAHEALILNRRGQSNESSQPK